MNGEIEEQFWLSGLLSLTQPLFLPKQRSRCHCEYSHSTRKLSWISNGDKKRYEFFSRNNFHYCGLVCHRSNLESPFASVTKNKQLQQHRYIKNIPNSQWSRILKNSEILHHVRISQNIFHLKVHQDLCQISS